MFHTPQINPIYRKGTRDAAALLVHGFTGTPDIMRPLANDLHTAGFTVFAPLLPGHGTTRENLEKTTWRDWYGGLTRALADLRSEHAQIGIAGLSLGGLLALKLAAEQADPVRAIACLATPIRLKPWIHWAVPLLRRTPLKWAYRYQKKVDMDVKDPSVKPNIWNIEDIPLASVESLLKLQGEVRGDLGRVTVPTLLMHARHDFTAPYENMGLIAGKLGSTVTETVTLENSYHLITVDNDRDLVCRKVREFFLRHVA